MLYFLRKPTSEVKTSGTNAGPLLDRYRDLLFQGPAGYWLRACPALAQR